MSKKPIPENPSTINPTFNKTAIDILNKRYLIKDKDNNVIETPAEMLWRVAYNIATADGNYITGESSKKILDQAVEFYEMMANLEFMPNSPTLMNAGNDLQMLSACVSGDTIIHTLEGEFTIKQLTEMYSDPKETFDVYSCDKNKLVVGKAFYPRLTKNNAKVYEITLSTGYKDVKGVGIQKNNKQLKRFDTNVVKNRLCKIKVTADHKLMMRDNTYKSIDDGIKIGDSIMPFDNLCDNYFKNAAPHNHKIVSIVEVGEEDVYDMSVHKYHNFAAEGIFVHNCFVLPIEDSMESIFETIKNTALIHKSGGGCIAAGSNVVTSTGRKKIEDVKVNDLVYSVNEKTHEWGLNKVTKTHQYSSDDKKILKVKLQHKTEVVTTDWHPFGVLREEGIEWVRADELKKDDLIISGANEEFEYVPYYWFLGLIASDGEIFNTGTYVFDKNHTLDKLRIFKTDENLMKRVSDIIGVDYKPTTNTLYTSDTLEISTTSESILNDLKQFYLINNEWKKAHNVRIPQQIFDATYSERISYIIGLLDGDGTYDEREENFSYYTINQDFGNDLMALLATVGIESSYQIIKSQQKNNNLIEVSFDCTHGIIEDLIEHSIVHNIEDITFKLSSNHDFKSNSNKDWLNYSTGSKKVISVKPHEKVDLFDLTVENSATYLASTSGSPVVVHNTGFSFSKLRPQDDFVKSTQGISSGPLSFMSVYDKATEVIAQAGKRRGANMGILRIDHPDIIDFIKVKSDLHTLNNFNLSVAITDKFMTALKNNEDYELVNPRDNKVVKKVNAKKVFDQIVKQAWTSGEPGLIFIDEINRLNPTRHYCEIEATNPCQPGWTPIRHKNGIIQIKDVQVGESIWSSDGWTKVVRKECTGVKSVYCYESTAGNFYGTENHSIISNGKKLEIKDAESIDTLQCDVYKTTLFDKIAVMDGLLIGDGTYHKASKKILLCIGKNDQDYFDSFISGCIDRSYCREDKFLVESTIESHELPHTYDREIPERYRYATPRIVSSFLSGLFSANGTVLENYNRISLKTSSKNIARQVQVMLSGLGISSYITTTKANDIKHYNGTFTTKENYNVNISTCRKEFAGCITFLQKYKQEKLLKIINVPVLKNKKNYEILRSYKISEESVYSITVDNESHTYWSFGFNTGNCGELPLEPHNSCNLGSINLATCVKQSGDGETVIDYDKIKRLVESGVHFLDNVIDMNNYPLDIIEKTTKLYRKIGLGIMGFSDLLYKIKIPYTSKTALITANSIMSFINKHAYEYSIKLGKDRGIYPVYEKPDNVEFNKPCRNAVRTTIAPTGTISILANCSSGIEPTFSLAFVRRIMDDDEFFETNPIFEKVARENSFYSEDIIKQLAKDGTVKNIDGIPDEFKKYFESAHDIPPISHVKMQAAFQKHIDNSISKTINFSKNATLEDVEQAYLLAYELKCKGITIYRDGSRDNQVLNIDNKESLNKTVVADKRIKKNRPKRLIGSTLQLTTGCGNIYVTINEDDNGNIFEVFNSIGKAGGCAACQSESIGKLISLAFRSGQSVESVIKQLIGISCHRPHGFGANTILSCSDAIAKALIEYVETKNGEKINIENKSAGGACPDCGGIISFESGCQMCHSCGWSACS